MMGSVIGVGEGGGEGRDWDSEGEGEVVCSSRISVTMGSGLAMTGESWTTAMGVPSVSEEDSSTISEEMEKLGWVILEGVAGES